MHGLTTSLEGMEWTLWARFERLIVLDMVSPTAPPRYSNTTAREFAIATSEIQMEPVNAHYISLVEAEG